MAREQQDLWREWFIVGPMFDSIHQQVSEGMSFADDCFPAWL
jgi:hypothetical protein